MTELDRSPAPHHGNRISIGILGDSDSQSYQGRILFSPGSDPAGGEHHAITLQWPEILARMREKQVDLGAWGIWGLPRWLSLARLRDALGQRWRGPRKEDYRYNLAWPSRTVDLMTGAWRQVPRLTDIMDENPAIWRNGVVIIRIGINDFGKESLDHLAVDADAKPVVLQMNRSANDIAEAVRVIRATHPLTYIILVGILDNANDPSYFSRFQSAGAMSNIRRGLDRFDNALRSIAGSNERMAFFDDRAWFARHWGSRDENGVPAYKAVSLQSGFRVTNTIGDSPDNAVLGNGHAGLVWNALWVQALVHLMQATLGLPISPISDTEVDHFVRATIGRRSGV